MGKEKNKKTFDVKRFASAIIGFPIVALIFIFGNKYIIDVFLTIVALLSMYEYLNAVSQKVKPVKWISYLSCILIVVIHIIPNEFIGTLSFLALPLLLVLLFFQIVVTNMKTNFEDAAYTFFGICYIVFCVGSISLIRGLENGVILIWYLIISGWGSDVFAYLIGKNFGEHKFSEVSPKKSVEGCIAGIVGAVIFSVLFTVIVNKFMNLNYSYLIIGMYGLIFSVIGQLGDFAASAIKRYVGVKDYGNLIPGHGGMMDRIDSILFIAPFAYILLGLI